MRFLLLALVLLFAVGCEGQTSRKPAKITAYQASWCQPCQRDKPALAELERQGITVVRVDCSEHAPAWVRSLPTYVVCIGTRCYPPVHSIDEVKRQLGM